jgi:hypothetical protein
MPDMPDDIERLEDIAADMRARLARIEDRIRRLKDAQWAEFQKQRAAALGARDASNGLAARQPINEKSLPSSQPKDGEQL